MGKPSGPLTLPPDERLRRPSEFQSVFQRGTRVERPSLVALWCQGPGGRKVGFTVSRQVRGAVARNRVRRRLREAYRRQQAALPPGIRCVFVGRPRAVAAGFGELLQDVGKALDEMGRQGRREAGPRPRAREA